MTGTSRWSRWAAVVSMLVLLLPLSQSRDDPLAQPTHAGLIGDAGPVARSCQGVAVTPTDDVQRVIDSHPPAMTLCLSAGTYRLDTPLLPKRGIHNYIRDNMGPGPCESRLVSPRHGRPTKIVAVVNPNIEQSMSGDEAARGARERATEGARKVRRES